MKFGLFPYAHSKGSRKKTCLLNGRIRSEGGGQEVIIQVSGQWPGAGRASANKCKFFSQNKTKMLRMF